MCGRFAFYSPHEAVRETFGVEPDTLLEPGYNRAPSQASLIIRLDVQGTREAAWLRWGLVPSWSRSADIGNRMINARAETVATKPSFRAAFRRRRCIVPADGFYEWQQTEGHRHPWFIRARHGGLFGFAGLWEHWDKAEQPLETFTILTTGAADSLDGIHHRMPVIVSGDQSGTWLDPQVEPGSALETLLDRSSSFEFEFWRVSTQVNNPRNQGRELITPVKP